MVRAIEGWLPGWEVMGGGGGLHLTVELPSGLEEAKLVTAAAHLGQAVLGLQAMSQSGTSGPGIVLSYARATPDTCDDAVRRLRQAAAMVDRVTPEMEAATASGSLLWLDAGESQHSR